MCKLLRPRAIAISTNYPQADGQTKRMNCTIGQILHTHLLDENQEHWPDYVAIIEMAINFTISAIINKVPFEVLDSENIPLSVGF